MSQNYCLSHLDLEAWDLANQGITSFNNLLETTRNMHPTDYNLWRRNMGNDKTRGKKNQPNTRKHYQKNSHGTTINTHGITLYRNRNYTNTPRN